ncbi:MAG: transcriptional repressor NrdR [Gammaproteobacteria bacterium]|nr:transcriptional regulator NrdR [Gammaproteobacteria bacterium]MYH69775.1 transcriptional repressor NrdR [Gammaproteobacteria bacterium]
MRCPFCSFEDTRVIDSRMAAEGDLVRRRRECMECRERFTTYEAAEFNYPRVIKSDGRREQFTEDKLRSGIERALEKRPVPMEQVEIAIARIKHKLRSLGDREVKSRKVGDWVMEELKAVDQVAYLRFASVYQSFADVRAFLDEIEKLEDEMPPDLKKSQLDLLNEPED